MAENKTLSDQANHLRRQAEEKAAKMTENQEALSADETRQMLHALRVHQIELEMQNEELRRAQLELDAARARYFDLYDLAPVGYCTLSEKGLILETNLTAATLLGVARGALVKQSFSRFILKADQDIYYLHRKQLFDAGEQQACDLRMVKNDGTLFWAHLSATAAQDSEGGESVWHCVMSDITDLKRVEAEKAELEVRNRQLQKAESLGIMAGAIAHHFNNQHQVVMGNLEMAIGELHRDSHILETLTDALKAARKAAEVSALMLTYRGQAPLNLSETCRQSLALLQVATPKGITLKADIPSSGPVVRANAGQIQQVLTHLVSNAWEAIDQNTGTIDLTIKTVSQADIPISRRFPIDWKPKESVYACLEVADTGCGIANKDIEKLFDPFFTTKFTGRGLGLPVVLGIAGSHGGGVTVESGPGRGSVFRFFLPVSAEEIPIPLEKVDKAREIEGGGTVLVVEDEAQVRKMVKKMLTHMGFTVLEARDGIEAVEVFRQHQDEIRCVLCDLTMPRMDGWETLATLRSLKPGIPFVLSSGYDKEQAMAGKHAILPQAFLNKPYQLKELRDTISRTLSNKADLCNGSSES